VLCQQGEVGEWLAALLDWLAAGCSATSKQCHGPLCLSCCQGCAKEEKE